MGIPRSNPEGEVPPPAEVEAVLRENGPFVRAVFEAGRREFPAVPLPYDLFAGRLVAIVHRRPLGEYADRGQGHFLARLARVAAPDIFLAIACEERIPGAWEAFSAHHAGEIRRAASRHRAPGTDSEEIAEGILGDLFHPPAGGGSRTRIGTWDGSGPLGAWLLAVLRNRFLDAKRGSDGEARRRVARGRLGDGGSPWEDPAEAAEAREARARFEGALRDAWGGLTPSEKLAITLKFRDGRRQVEIASLLGVGEPRVSRIVASALGKLRAGLRPDLPEGAWPGMEGPWGASREPSPVPPQG